MKIKSKKIIFSLISLLIVACALAIFLLKSTENRLPSVEKSPLIPMDIMVGAAFQYSGEESGACKLLTEPEKDYIGEFFQIYSEILDTEEGVFEEEWLYRITFYDKIESNAEDKNSLIIPDDANTCVVLVGEKTVLINGVLFKSMKNFNDLVQSKYNFYD